jgi:hypothetical protein
MRHARGHHVGSVCGDAAAAGEAWCGGTITPKFKVKTEYIHLCMSGSIFTHKVTNSKINSITSVYYNIS